MASCKSCDAAIQWCSWEATGKWIPLDAAPVTDGDLVETRGKVRKYTDEDQKLHRPRRRAHWATCPNAAQHRNR